MLLYVYIYIYIYICLVCGQVNGALKSIVNAPQGIVDVLYDLNYPFANFAVGLTSLVNNLNNLNNIVVIIALTTL